MSNVVKFGRPVPDPPVWVRLEEASDLLTNLIPKDAGVKL